MYDFDGGGVNYSSLLDNVANLSILKRYDDTGLTQKNDVHCFLGRHYNKTACVFCKALDEKIKMTE